MIDFIGQTETEKSSAPNQNDEDSDQMTPIESPVVTPNANAQPYHLFH